jgi:S-adenosylmethionine:tRNA ribosyltransferase-isomerase
MSIPTSDYHYNLPADRIAEFPLANRDESNLLVYTKGKIEHTIFKCLPDFLPSNATLFFNNTRVIPARIFFTKETGATLEVLLLAPTLPSPVMAESMQAIGECTWECTIGNLKRWKPSTRLTQLYNGITLSAELLDRDKGLVKFSWLPSHLAFAEVVVQAGVTPLPPYIGREAEPEDATRYQTIYAQREGAVAAPTAGLHFTDRVLHTLDEREILTDFLTLHVSAGTFQPIKTENATAHTMHREQIVVTRKNIEHLLAPDRSIIAVGTTSLRTLESIYWFGRKLILAQDAEFVIQQDDPYLDTGNLPSTREAIEAVRNHMERKGSDSITGHTSIYIYPGYVFRVCKGLITNFHLPGSTLMLLVAAFVGNSWRRIYDEALSHNYRFLSYGDSSLLLP